MKPAWDKLGDEYKSSKTVLIADVDCTKEQDLCQKYGVQGYPTIKYFTGATAATGDSYQGGRDYDTLSKWAKDNLGPTCGAENIDLCTDDQKAVIKEKQARFKYEKSGKRDSALLSKTEFMAGSLQQMVNTQSRRDLIATALSFFQFDASLSQTPENVFGNGTLDKVMLGVLHQQSHTTVQPVPQPRFRRYGRSQSGHRSFCRSVETGEQP